MIDFAEEAKDLEAKCVELPLADRLKAYEAALRRAFADGMREAAAMCESKSALADPWIVRGAADAIERGENP